MANFGKMIIFAATKLVEMIRERIYQQMLKRGVNQVMLCNDLSLTLPNFNAFIRGKRTMPYKDLVAVMKYLRLSVAPQGMESTSSPVESMSEIFRERVKQGGLKLVEVEAAAGVNRSTISSFITGRSVTSSKNLGKMMQALGLDIVPFKKN